MKTKALIIFILLLLSGCALKKVEKIPSFGKLASQEQTEKFSSALTKPAIQSFRSLIRVQQQYQGKKASYRQAVAYQAENYLLMEAFPLNSFFTLSRLTITPDSYLLVDFQNGKKYSGDFSDNLLKDLFGMDFTVTEFASLMLGQLPPYWQEQLKIAEYYINGDTAQINIKADGIYLEIDPKQKRISKVIVYDKLRDKIKFTIDYNKYAELNKFSYPADLTIHFADSSLDILVRQQLNSHNQKLSPKVFIK